MPLLVPLLVPFFAIIAAFVLIGLSHTHTAAHGSTGIKGFLNTAISNSLLGELYGLGVKAARSLVSRYAASHLRMLTAYLNGLAHLWKGIFTALSTEAGAADRLARTTERAIPRVAHKAAAPALARAKVADRHATHALAQGHVTAKELHRFRTTTRARLKADAHAIDVTIPRDLGRLRTREEELARDQAKLKERTKALENGALKAFEWIRAHPFALATTVFAGAVAVALGRLGLGGLRCRNFRNLLSRFGCGLGTLLNDLLGVVIAGIVLESVCEFLPLVEDAFGAIAGPMVHLLNEVPLGDCETLPDGWARLSVAHGPLPPPQTLGSFPS